MLCAAACGRLGVGRVTDHSALRRIVLSFFFVLHYPWDNLLLSFCHATCFSRRPHPPPDSILELLLDLFWEKLPEGLIKAFPGIPSSLYWLWIPVTGMMFASMVGISIYFLGFPGDLGYTVNCVHELGYVPMGHAPSMIVSSQASILAGGSLGPEAPLVAICASIAGWVSMVLFGVSGRKRLRAHTLSGMACALAAFFGVPLGGSLFALEINHRLGFEYYEHAVVAVASGSTCLVVFRWLAGLAIAPIWNVTPAGGGRWVSAPRWARSWRTWATRRRSWSSLGSPLGSSARALRGCLRRCTPPLGGRWGASG